jgi:ParB-like chromosome segregation protein Spo0J
MNKNSRNNKTQSHLHVQSENSSASTATVMRGTGAGQKLAIEYKSPHELKPNPKNPRTHSEKQIEQIACSIDVFDFNVPALINAAGCIIAGHGRVEAAKRLGLSSIPVIRLEHLTPTQVTAFAVADNKLTDNSAWDEQLLAEQLKYLSEAELDFSMEAIGFETAEIDLLIDGLDGANNAQNDPADELPDSRLAIPVSQEGDLWMLSRHRILCADALKEKSFLVLMDRQKAAVVFTDPPYNVKINGHVSGLGKIKHREFTMGCGEMSEGQFTNFLTRACAPHPVEHGQLDAAQVNHLSETAFAFPRLRKEPMTDASHVRNAIARFDQVDGASDEERDLAFANIKAAAEHFGIRMKETSWRQLDSPSRRADQTSGEE